MSPNAWVDCGGQTYILDVPRYGFVMSNDTSLLPPKQKRQVGKKRPNGQPGSHRPTQTQTKQLQLPVARPLRHIENSLVAHHTVDLATFFSHRPWNQLYVGATFTSKNPSFVIHPNFSPSSIDVLPGVKPKRATHSEGWSRSGWAFPNLPFSLFRL